MVTQNQYCQNPSHAHHHSHHHHQHHNQSGYRHLVARTVVEESNPEESTGGSIVTVIDNTASIKANDSTPDIVLTNSETDTQPMHTDEHLSITTRSLSIQSIDNEDETVNASTSATMTTTIFQATETIQNDNSDDDAGTGSLQIYNLSANYCKHTINMYGIWAIK